MSIFIFSGNGYGYLFIGFTSCLCCEGCAAVIRPRNKLFFATAALLFYAYSNHFKRAGYLYGCYIWRWGLYSVFPRLAECCKYFIMRLPCKNRQAAHLRFKRLRVRLLFCILPAESRCRFGQLSAGQSCAFKNILP